MDKTFAALSFVLIWGFTIGSTVFVWASFGTLVGIVYFLFFAGLAGVVGMGVAAAIGAVLGMNTGSGS